MTLFDRVFGGCNINLYIKEPEYVKELLRQNREERGLSFKQIIIKRQKEFATFCDKIAGLPKAMRGKSEKDI